MASAQDMKAANQTYGSFISVAKWATPLLALVAALVVFLITR